MSKTINDSNIDLEKLSASKVRQLAKKLESSKSTAKHIKKMPSNPQAAQIHMLRHQRSEIEPNKAKRKQSKQNKFRTRHSFNEENHHQAPYKQNEFDKKFNPKQIPQSSDSGDSKHIEGFYCSSKRHQCRHSNKFGNFSSLCYRKEELYKKKPRSTKAWQLTCGRLSTHESSISGLSSDISFSEREPFCLQMKVQDKKANASVPVPRHLVTILEFEVKP